MANFEKAFNRVIKAEGGYVNDPNDKGGETYLGISRRSHPNSSIWEHIDKIKKDNPNSSNSKLTKLIKKNDYVHAVIKDIYYTKYWDKLRCDEIKSQKLAEQLFDMAVNAGVSRAISIMCTIINYPTYSNTVTDKFIESINNYGKRINTYKV